MIPDNVFIRVSFFLAQRPSPRSFSESLRCHSTWRNAPLKDLQPFALRQPEPHPSFPPSRRTYRCSHLATPPIRPTVQAPLGRSIGCQRKPPPTNRGRQSYRMTGAGTPQLGQMCGFPELNPYGRTNTCSPAPLRTRRLVRPHRKAFNVCSVRSRQNQKRKQNNV